MEARQCYPAYIMRKSSTQCRVIEEVAQDEGSTQTMNLKD